MSWFGIGAAENAVDNVLDKDNGLLTQVGGWISRMDLTDEDLIIANAKTVSTVQKFAADTISENSARSLARRLIASRWINVQLFFLLLCAGFAPFNMDLAKFYFELATCNVMLAGTSAIIIFHFGSYGLARHNESKKG